MSSSSSSNRHPRPHGSSPSSPPSRTTSSSSTTTTNRIKISSTIPPPPPPPPPRSFVPSSASGSGGGNTSVQYQSQQQQQQQQQQGEKHDERISSSASYSLSKQRDTIIIHDNRKKEEEASFNMEMTNMKYNNPRNNNNNNNNNPSTRTNNPPSKQKSQPPPPPPPPPQPTKQPTLEPYVGKLERFELFSTGQCYYLVACDKHGISYRVLKMDRTLIERQSCNYCNGGGTTNNEEENVYQGGGGGGEEYYNRATPSSPDRATTTSAGGTDPSSTPLPSNSSSPNKNNLNNNNNHEEQHNRKPTLRRLSEFTTEDPNVYTQTEIRDMLDMIHDGNRNRSTSFDERGNKKTSSEGGGLKPIAKAFGIVGFIRFLDCYYLTLITKRVKVGSIGGNGIYSIKSTETFPLKPAERAMSATSTSDGQGNDPSSMLLSMWNRGKRSVGLGLTNREIAELRYQGLYQVVDLTKDFFFSYTYDITRSLQENFLFCAAQPFPPPPFKDMYAWNFFLTRELEECTSSLTSFHWVLPIIHGAFIQCKLNDYGRSLNLTLLARRSRHFAGTRYLKRGVSDRGKVANDVEHEQIMHDETTSAASGTFSSFLQVRGSIPTYWTQESSVTMPKPPIVLNRVDPTYHATQAHFDDLLGRYGSPIVVVDLVKQSEKREREVIVGNEFRHAVDYLNNHIDEKHKVRYCALDYSHISKHRNLNVSSSLNEVATWAVNQTGFFCSAPRWKIVEGGRVEPIDESTMQSAAFLSHQLGVPVFPMEQKGVLRTNCIDCLDRTNVAQFSAGVDALGQQLVVMGIRSSAKLDPSSNIVRMLIDMYVKIGDHIALQYGGSEAHKKVATAGTQSNIPGPMGKHKELLTSIRRYYSNSFTDRLKQDGMNLFLGYYIPSRHTVPLWELENDYYLHNFHVKAGRGSLQSMKAYQRMFGLEWSDDEDDDEGYERDSAVSTPNWAPKSRRRPDLIEQNWRIDRVQKRCNAQNEALSVWWKVAIQSYIQQRMWMQLGRSPIESLLPPRFERLYQPDKLAQFDKFFARSWATPMRLSHSAQHSRSSEDDPENTAIHRTISSTPSLIGTKPTISGEDGEFKSDLPQEKEDSSDGDDSPTVRGYIHEHGFKPKSEPALTRFLRPHEIRYLDYGNNSTVGNLQESWAEDEPTVNFLGSLGSQKEPCQEYLKYANSSDEEILMPGRFRGGAREEFAQCLHDTMLDSDDVEGIQRLAESAHIGSEIRTGLYRGLPQSASAMEVTTVIQEQFNILENRHEHGDPHGEGLQFVDDRLRRCCMDKSGVKATILNDWDRRAMAEEAYKEIVDTSSIGCKRSDLTTEGSMKLYSSFFDESTRISGLGMMYMLGEENHGDSTTQKKKEADKEPFTSKIRAENSSFARKAALIGIPVSSRRSESQQTTPSLFSFQNQRAVPAGFEQINEDLYARRDNKFMVFNGAGVDYWNGMIPRPVTKIHNIEEDLLVR